MTKNLEICTAKQLGRRERHGRSCNNWQVLVDISSTRARIAHGRVLQRVNGQKDMCEQSGTTRCTSYKTADRPLTAGNMLTMPSA